MASPTNISFPQRLNSFLDSYTNVPRDISKFISDREKTITICACTAIHTSILIASGGTLTLGLLAVSIIKSIVLNAAMDRIAYLGYNIINSMRGTPLPEIRADGTLSIEPELKIVGLGAKLLASAVWIRNGVPFPVSFLICCVLPSIKPTPRPTSRYHAIDYTFSHNVRRRQENVLRDPRLRQPAGQEFLFNPFNDPVLRNIRQGRLPVFSGYRIGSYATQRDRQRQGTAFEASDRMGYHAPLGTRQRQGTAQPDAALRAAVNLPELMRLFETLEHIDNTPSRPTQVVNREEIIVKRGIDNYIASLDTEDKRIFLREKMSDLDPEIFFEVARLVAFESLSESVSEDLDIFNLYTKTGIQFTQLKSVFVDLTPEEKACLKNKVYRSLKSSEDSLPENLEEYSSSNAVKELYASIQSFSSQCLVQGNPPFSEAVGSIINEHYAE